PGAHETFANVSRALAQRLGSLPHLACRIARGLCRAHASFVEGPLGFARLLPSRTVRVVELLLLGRLPELCGLRLHLLKTRLERRNDVAAERRGVHLQLGKLMAQRVEIPLEVRPFLVSLGFALRRLASGSGGVLVLHGRLFLSC